VYLTYLQMDNFQNKTDVELVSLALADQDIFLHLMQRYEKKLLRYIRRFTGLSTECAEDALQESFIKIYQNLNSFDSSLSFSSWAYRITHNETVTYLRKTKKIETVSIEVDGDDETSLIDVLQSDVDIEHEVSRNDLNKKIREAINMLSPKYREVLVLKYLEDLSYDEISDVLKIPMGTVGTLVNRAKTQFKQIAEKNNLNSLM